jgi:hypothetical protein
MAIINPGDVPINEGQVDGTELARRLERLYAVVHSQNSSASRPPAITPGGIWSKTVAGGFDVMVYDGTQDVKIGSVINGTPNFTEGALLTTGGTMSGAIDMGNSKITNIDTPTAAGDALAWGKPASVTTLTATGALNANGGLSTTGVATFSAGTAAAPAITTTGDTNTGIFFPAADSIAFSEGGVEAMRIDSNGNLGIGTSSPGAKLDINGDFYLRRSNTLRSKYFYDTSINAINITTEGAIPLAFSTNAVERMRISSNGELLIGNTTSVGNKVYVQTNNQDAMFLWSDGAASSLNCRKSNTAGGFILFNYSGTGVGSISTNGTSVAYNTASDYRLKENIAPMTGALAKVQALKPVTYKWKADGADGQGFIAHELQEVVPDAVTGEKDSVEKIGNILDAENNIIQENVTEPVGEGKIDGQVWQFVKERPVYQGIDTSFLVGTLTAAIQELKAIVDAQAKRIEALEAK